MKTNAPERRELVVIGAGPAGLAGATAAAAAGLDVLLLDEQPGPGGQVWRSAETPTLAAQWLGEDYLRGTRAVERLRQSSVDYRPATSVWDVGADRVLRVSGPRGSHAIAAERLLLATGAIERPFPLPGWTLPGVMTAGGAQTLMKSAGIVPADGAVLAGTGPLLLLLAWQMLRAGSRPAALLETTPLSNYRRALPHLPAMLGAGGQLAKGLRWLREIRRAGIPHLRGVRALRAEGNSHLQRVRYTHRGREATIDTRLLLLHQGVVPNVNMSMALGCRHYWDDWQLCFRPALDEWGDTDVTGVAMAGDGAGIGGMLVAEAAGALAGVAAACALNRIDARERDHRATPQRAPLARARAARPFLEALYRPRDEHRIPPDDDTIVCRCEEVSAGRVRDEADRGLRDANALKSRARCGMGPCQGRYCGLTVTEMLADAHGIEPREVGYYRIRPPLKPVPLEALVAFDPGPPPEANLLVAYGGIEGQAP